MTEPIAPMDPETDVDAFARARRRRTLIAGIAALVVVAGLAIAIAIDRADDLPALDPKQVAEIREALDQIPAEHRRALSAAALVELEVGRIPLALRNGFDDLAGMPPGMGDLALVRPIADDPEARAAWLLACPSGAAVLAEAVQAADPVPQVFERCDLGRLGLVTAGEIGGASLGELVATHAVWAHLVEHDAETDIERRLLRTILGRG